MYILFRDQVTDRSALETNHAETVIDLDYDAYDDFDSDSFEFRNRLYKARGRAAMRGGASPKISSLWLSVPQDNTIQRWPSQSVRNASQPGAAFSWEEYASLKDSYRKRHCLTMGVINGIHVSRANQIYIHNSHILDYGCSQEILRVALRKYLVL